MLFSDRHIADYINDSFEPYWGELRPVPTIRIDFQNGHVIRRTLQGNIATLICAPGSEVLDVIPGMYVASTYLEKLKECRANLEVVARESGESRRKLLAMYHRNGLIQIDKQRELEAARLRRPVSSRPMFDGSKMSSQSAIKELVRPGSQPTPPIGLTDLDDTSRWEALIADTQNNEFHRRRSIHVKLHDTPVSHSSELIKWLYKDVLHADLDDPYLGLGETLFGNYPFNQTDQRMGI